MTTPSIPHASNCVDPKSELQAARRTGKSAVGEMWQLTYGCLTCGRAVDVKHFEAAEIEEED